MPFNYLLLFLSFICFCLATVGVSHPRINFVALGLACWVLTLLTPLVR
jgi:hypothetical protein